MAKNKLKRKLKDVKSQRVTEEKTKINLLKLKKLSS